MPWKSAMPGKSANIAKKSRSGPSDCNIGKDIATSVNFTPNNLHGISKRHPDQIKAKALTYLTEEMRQVVAEFYDKLERLSDYKPNSKLQEKKREMELAKEFDTMSIKNF